MDFKKLLTCFIAAFCCVCLSGIPCSANLSENSIKKKIVKEAQKQDFCPYLALSVARQESEFKTDAQSPVGAIGLFQLMPDTAKDLEVNPYDVNQNIHGGIKYLKTLKRQFGSNELMLAAYNAGPGTVNKYNGIPPYEETRNYVKNIMKYYKNYKNNSDNCQFFYFTCFK